MVGPLSSHALFMNNLWQGETPSMNHDIQVIYWLHCICIELIFICTYVDHFSYAFLLMTCIALQVLWCVLYLHLLHILYPMLLESRNIPVLPCLKHLVSIHDHGSHQRKWALQCDYALGSGRESVGKRRIGLNTACRAQEMSAISKYKGALMWTVTVTSMLTVHVLHLLSYPGPNAHAIPPILSAKQVNSPGARASRICTHGDKYYLRWQRQIKRSDFSRICGRSS